MPSEAACSGVFPESTNKDEEGKEEDNNNNKNKIINPIRC
jgi:hypothetical protein